MEQIVDPFVLLHSDNSMVRLRAARALLESASPLELAKIQGSRARETDSWVQATLDRAIQNITAPPATFRDSDGLMPLQPELTDDIRAQAIQYVSSVMLHELRPLVGDVYRAVRSMGASDFETSDAHRSIKRLQEFLTTMHRLHDAAAPPNIIQFDLVQLLAEEIAAGGYGESQVSALRSDTLVVLGDPELLKFAVQNCIRNAVEATPMDGEAVVITCGSNQRETWVAILDEGEGLPESKDKLLEPGNTMKSKDEHFGMGLPIAQRAMKSFGGFVTLTPRKSGGTSCELRWGSGGTES